MPTELDAMPMPEADSRPLQCRVRMRHIGKIELLQGIEAELKEKIQWLRKHDRPGEAMRGAIYAYRESIRILRKYHVGWPASVKPAEESTLSRTVQT